MLKDIKKLLEHNAFYLAIFTTLFIAFLSLTAIPKIDLDLGFNLKYKDKLLHMIAYFSLTFIWLFVYREKVDTKKIRIKLIVFLISYGTILEVLQSGLTNYRTGDFFDIIANFSGIMLATITFDKFLNWFNSI